MTEHRVGCVEHHDPRAHAAAIHLAALLKTGDEIHIRDRDDGLIRTVDSLQLDRQPVMKGKAGQSVGVLVGRPVHDRAEVFVLARQ